MSESSFRRVARTGLAPLLEDVPEGPAWTDLNPETTLVPPTQMRFGWLVGVGAAVVVLVVIGVAAFLTGDEPVPPPATEATSTTHSPDASAMAEFDLLAFVESKLFGAFEDGADHIGLVVLVSDDQELAVERALDLDELVGYTHVPAIDVVTAAARFAEANRMEMPNASWVAYGLEPQYIDTPIDEWQDALDEIPGAVVAAVEFAPRDTGLLARGWAELDRLGFDIASGAVVEAVARGLVIVQSDMTIYVDLTQDQSDFATGSWVETDAPPFPFQDQCCGGAAGFAVGDDLVVLNESMTATWLFDTSEMVWRELDPRPSTGFVLGAAFFDDQLTIINASPRTGAGESTVASLDLSAGSWQELPSLPSPISVGGVTHDGGRIFVAGTQQDENNQIVDGSHVFEWAGSDWQSLLGTQATDRLPIGGQAATVAWVEGAGLLAWNYDLDWSLMASGEWGQVGTVPMDEGECYPITISAPGGAVGLCGGIAWFDAQTLTWSSIPVPSQTGGKLVVSGSRLVALIVTGRESTTMAEFPLPPD